MFELILLSIYIASIFGARNFAKMTGDRTALFMFLCFLPVANSVMWLISLSDRENSLTKKFFGE